jgi:hypothetical protein
MAVWVVQSPFLALTEDFGAGVRGLQDPDDFRVDVGRQERRDAADGVVTSVGWASIAPAKSCLNSSLAGKSMATEMMPQSRSSRVKSVLRFMFRFLLDGSAQRGVGHFDEFAGSARGHGDPLRFDRACDRGTG